MQSFDTHLTWSPPDCRPWTRSPPPASWGPQCSSPPPFCRRACWRSLRPWWRPGGNCIKIGSPGKPILRYYFQENRTSWRLSDKISLLRRLENKSSLRLIPRESVFPEDLIGGKYTFKTYSFVKYALKKTFFKGLEKISLKLDLF